MIQECDTNDESIVHISKILIKLKASRNFMKAKIFIYVLIFLAGLIRYKIQKECYFNLPFSGGTTALSQLIIKTGLMTMERQQNNLLYQSLEQVSG